MNSAVNPYPVICSQILGLAHEHTNAWNTNKQSAFFCAKQIDGFPCATVTLANNILTHLTLEQGRLAYAVVSPTEYESIEKKFDSRDHATILGPYADLILLAVSNSESHIELHFTENRPPGEHRGEV